MNGGGEWVTQAELSFLQGMPTAASNDPSVVTAIFMHFDGVRATFSMSGNEAFDR